MKKRLDNYLFEKGYFDSKTKAQNAIIARDVQIDGETVFKPSFVVDDTKEHKIVVKTLKYVSRGGFKLEKAICEFGLCLKDAICLDAGASTGGFTDCMLQNGAKFVYSVDVGYGQLSWKLRNDSRVKVIERTNIKNCSFNQIYGESDPFANFCAMDLSFISILKVLENVTKLLKEESMIVCLVKPQFEVGKENVGKNGVVRDKKVHFSTITEIIEKVQIYNLNPCKLTYSPITGPKGNIEYLLLLKKGSAEKFDINVEKIVASAFSSLV